MYCRLQQAIVPQLGRIVWLGVVVVTARACIAEVAEKGRRGRGEMLRGEWVDWDIVAGDSAVPLGVEGVGLLYITNACVLFRIGLKGAA